MRTSLLVPLLATLRRNLGRGARDTALFEQGLVFHPVAGAGTPPAMGVDRRPTDEQFAAADAVLPRQPWHVAAVLAGEFEPAGWWGPGRRAEWADAVQAARLVCRGGRRAGRPCGPASYAPWHPGRCAEIVVDGAVVGHAGELHPAVCAALELPKRTCAMEINLDALPLPGVTAGPGGVDLPAGADRRGAGGRRRGAGGAGRGGARRRVPATCSRRSACSTCTPVRRSARGASRWRTS